MRGSKAEISSGVWRIRAFTGRRRENGSPIFVSRYVRAPERKAGAGARLADRELNKLVSSVSQGKVVSGSESLGTFLGQWLEHLETLGRSPTTMREYRRLVAKVVEPELGKVKLSKLTARHLDNLYAKLIARGLKPISVRHVHTLLGAALHQAERWGMVDTNVSRRAQPPAVHSKQVQAPDAEVVRAIVAEAEKSEPTMAVLLFLAAATGARRGELCALRWSDVDWKSGTLTVARSVYQTSSKGWDEKPTKTHQVRRMALDEYTQAILRQYRADADQLAEELGMEVPDGAFIFSRSPIGAEPIRPNVVTDFMARTARALGVDTHFHELRHFSATQLIAGGHDVRTVAGRLGHSDASVTLRVYAHALPERDRKAAAALGRLLVPQREKRTGQSSRAQLSKPT